MENLECVSLKKITFFFKSVK